MQVCRISLQASASTRKIHSPPSLPIHFPTHTLYPILSLPRTFGRAPIAVANEDLEAFSNSLHLHSVARRGNVIVIAIAIVIEVAFGVRRFIFLLSFQRLCVFRGASNQSQSQSVWHVETFVGLRLANRPCFAPSRSHIIYFIYTLYSHTHTHAETHGHSCCFCYFCVCVYACVGVCSRAFPSAFPQHTHTHTHTHTLTLGLVVGNFSHRFTASTSCSLALTRFQPSAPLSLALWVRLYVCVCVSQCISSVGVLLSLSLALSPSLSRPLPLPRGCATRCGWTTSLS